MSFDKEEIIDIITGIVSEILSDFDIIKRKLNWQYDARAYDVYCGEKILGTIWIPYEKDEIKFLSGEEEKTFSKSDIIAGDIWKKILPDLLSEALNNQNKC
ncbi:hypothetical protein BNJ_00144 [Kaumoebavirus]|uniref:hypothetical protein n=1 Tax=Kaumoebavirus TaxID=1859492 RepID=UPI0009C25409|nr:hypothetical protein BNJ_00144 [Kaumoebavirus]ARA71976.1 hypothetical protein BNJ_00144 [Kaumoebavirus]